MIAVRWVAAWGALVLLALVFAVARDSPQPAAADDRQGAPRFRVDPFWPKPLPHKWLVGQVAGVSVDADDHIWIVQRPGSLDNSERGASPTDAAGNPRPQGPEADCCLPAPSVMEFDSKGNLIQAWGGPADPGFIGPGGKCDPAAGCQWPENEHGIFVDHQFHVWLGGNGSSDHQVLKFSRDGTFLLQIGEAGVTGGSNDTQGSANGTPLLGRPADVELDPETNELYIADGYLNHRVVVVDATSGKYKRHWGAYGQSPVDDSGSDRLPAYRKNQAPDPHFRNPVHCAHVVAAEEKLVYICDRVNNRMQVFRPDGEFVTEFFVARETLGIGSVWDVDTSPDARKRYLFNADGTNQHIWTLLRASGDVVGSFGKNGRYAGNFHWVHNLAVDSRGNIYTGEVDDGKRVQKFVLVDD